jgi:hypothetical protein
MHRPGVTWGRACVWAEGGAQALFMPELPDGLYFCPRATPRHVGGRRRVKEILIYGSVMFIFTLGWFRAFFLMY